jgi:predicted GH43/DUF377 family glycosyl hydrolase
MSRPYLLIVVLAALAACNNAPVMRAKNEPGKWQLAPFTKVDSINPVLIPDSNSVFQDPILRKEIRWEAKDVFNPAAIVRNDTVFLIYRAEDKIGKYAGTSRIGLAWSLDGLHFKKNPLPVLFPANDEQKKYEWEGGCEDPRIVQAEKGTYYLMYTAYDGDKARLMVAVSQDLRHWIKKGHAFQKAYEGKYVNQWSKSGAVICKYVNGNPVAKLIDGKYWMYWGDTNIFLATSTDLINWAPIEEHGGGLKIIFGPRKGKFDSDLVEPGPAAMQTDDGILLMYNSRNVPSKGDTSLREGTYAAAQILFDSIDPSRIIARADKYFIKPEKSYEITGQVNEVCFIEGLVQHKGNWFLYYGTADSKIAVAVNSATSREKH